MTVTANDHNSFVLRVSAASALQELFVGEDVVRATVPLDVLNEAPPPIALRPAGQLASIILFDESLADFSVMSLTALTPAGPRTPVFPRGPAGPATPAGPGGPFGMVPPKEDNCKEPG